jgi:Uma2 family endonuclease
MTRLPATDSLAALWAALDVHSLGLTDEQFYLLCRDNPEHRFELTAERELIIMPPAYSGTGWRESEIIYQLAGWTKKDGTGICFSSSAGFTLPNGAKRSPDASWITLVRWKQLSWKQREREFAPICPDFVVELRSPTDSVPHLRKKMTEYIHNGARLGWLLDPLDKCVFVYRPRRSPERLENPNYVSGEDILPGFEFNFHEIL